MTGKILPVLLIFLGLVCAAYLVVSGGAAALLIGLGPACLLIWIFRKYADDKQFILFIFVGGLAARLAFGLMVHVYDLRDFFGGDAGIYDSLGYELLLRWTNAVRIPDPTVDWQLQNVGAGWGMFDLVAAIYYFVGRNILAAQTFCGVIGAGTAPMVYFCSKRVFQNARVARVSALLVAFFPSFIIWSGQLLKDGLIVFLLVVSMTMIVRLQEKFSYSALFLLFLSVAGILPLRFYIFYMLAMALVGSFVIGFSSSPQALFRNVIILLILGLGLTYVGVVRNASSAFDKFGSLAQVQSSRLDLAQSGKSGFASDIDVSTPTGAIGAVPTGLMYLMLAPFPWEISSTRSALTMPEVLVWWAMLPVMVVGMGWSIRNRLRRVFPILLFVLMLSIAYSIFQGNVGTAYRQRTQIQVFLFMFFAVGWTVRKEKQENKLILRTAQRRGSQAGLRPNAGVART